MATSGSDARALAVDQAAAPQNDVIGHVSLSLRPGAITAVLAASTALLVVLSTIGQVIVHTTGHDSALGFIPLFHVAREGNIATLFASCLLLFAAGLLALTGWRERIRQARDARYWFGLSLLFIGLALDEVAMLHERLIEPVRAALDATGLLYFAWVIPAGILVALVVVVLTPFLRRLPATTLKLFFLSGTLFVGGAIGMELLGGRYVEANGYGTPVWSALTTIEETLEMAGVVVFIHALLLYLRDTTGELRVKLEQDPRPS